jgi:hypothetical protein
MVSAFVSSDLLIASKAGTGGEAWEQGVKFADKELFVGFSKAKSRSNGGNLVLSFKKSSHKMLFTIRLDIQLII